MAKKPRGTASLIFFMRRICHYVRNYGVGGVSVWTSPAVASAMLALDVACRAWEGLDDQPGQIDDTADGYEDIANNS